MDVVWTRQVGAFIAAEGEGSNSRGAAFGYGCAVTRDGQDVYLSGLVGAGGAATDFSDGELGKTGWPANYARGGADVFVASYAAKDGRRNFLQQFGSTRDDFPSRGNGGIATDRAGNAILSGSTRGSLMRERGPGEYRYGPRSSHAAADVFVLSLERGTARHLPEMHDGVDKVPVAPLRMPHSVTKRPVIIPATAGASSEKAKGGAFLGVVSLCLGLFVLAAGAAGAVTYRAKTKNNEREALADHTNLHSSNHGQRDSPNQPGRRWSTWGVRSGRNSTMDDFRKLNHSIGVEVRNSATGGWHGVYEENQLQAINFNTPDETMFTTIEMNRRASGESESPDDPHSDNLDLTAPDSRYRYGGGAEGTHQDEDAVEDLLCTEDGLKEIEDSMDNYEIGEMDQDMSDEDLIKAYNGGH